MVYCWEKLEEALKWKVGYAAYHEAIKNGTCTLVVDGEDGYAAYLEVEGWHCSDSLSDRLKTCFHRRTHNKG
jgi:hypothetical protein